MPFEELPPDIKRSNEAAARRIPDILALVGLKVETGAATAEEETVVSDQLQRHIEPLAEEEHKGWMANAESEGLRFAEVRDDKKGLHNCLRPFHELIDLDKKKDRDTVMKYPYFVRLAGYKIVFIGVRRMAAPRPRRNVRPDPRFRVALRTACCSQDRGWRHR